MLSKSGPQRFSPTTKIARVHPLPWFLVTYQRGDAARLQSRSDYYADDA